MNGQSTIIYLIASRSHVTGILVILIGLNEKKEEREKRERERERREKGKRNE